MARVLRMRTTNGAHVLHGKLGWALRVGLNIMLSTTCRKCFGGTVTKRFRDESCELMYEKAVGNYFLTRSSSPRVPMGQDIHKSHSSSA